MVAGEWVTATDPARIEGAGADLLRAAGRLRDRVFGRRIRLFAPLYYSNVCANDCVYCGFRRSLGTTRRHVLSPEEVRDEAAALLKQGHRRILLIASEDPSPKGFALALGVVEAIAGIARIVTDRGDRPGDAKGASFDPAAAGLEAIRDPVRIFSAEPEITLALEMAPRSVSDFRHLAGAGVSTYVLFQETYDRAVYPRVHPAGPKADFDHRLEGPERAARAGIRRLGLGALYGLGDPVRDTVALVAHARRLEAVTGTPVASVSVPRLEPAEGVPFSAAPPHPVPDWLWLRIIAVLRLALPWSDVLISTREPADLRRAALEAGATMFSAGSRTDPGGYRRPGESRGQFEIGDDRSLNEVALDLRSSGFEAC